MFLYVMTVLNLTVVQNIPPILYLFIIYLLIKNWKKIPRTIKVGEKSISNLMISNLPDTIRNIQDD